MLLCALLLVSFNRALYAQAARQEGTIVRMRMTECLELQHKFMAQMSGGANPDAGSLCPEYVLVTEKVVYVISGKSSEQLIPLAEVTRFRLQKNEMLIRVDDAPKESHFHIRAMVMRQEWERNQMLEEAHADAMISRHLDPVAARDAMRDQQ